MLRESPRRAGRFVLEVDSRALSPVSVEMVVAFGLRVGLYLDAGSVAGLERASEAVDCHDRALEALARRARSTRGLERWLAARGYSAPAIATVTTRLTELGLLDDRSFARAFARARWSGRGHGLRRVAADLAREGVSRAMADSVLAQLRADEGPGAEAAAVKAAAERRVRVLRRLDPPVAERRLVGWLVRRGYGPGEAGRVARDLLRQR